MIHRPRPTTLPTLAVAAMATLGLAACGGDDGGTTTVVQAPAETVTVESAPTTTTAAPATTTGTSAATANGTPAASTSRSEAVRIARDRYPGERRVGGVRGDDDDDRPTWEVRLRTAGGAERTVTIDRADGRIVDTDVDRPDRDDRDDD